MNEEERAEATMTFSTWLTGKDTEGRVPEIAWHTPLHGMVRTPLPDADDPSALFVVTYREKFREYGVYRIDRATGDVAWTTQIRNGGYGSPLVHPDLLCALSRFTAVTGLDKRTGEVLWEYDTKARIRSSLARGVQPDEIVFSAGGDVHWVGIDGECRDRVTVPDSVLYGLAEAIEIDGREVVLTLGTRQRFRRSHIYMFAVARDGEIVWRTDLGEGYVVSSDTSGFARVGDNALVATGDKRVVAIDVHTGVIQWQSSIGVQGMRHTPVVGHGRAFVSTLEGELVSLDAETGGDMRSLPLTDKGIWMPPTVIGQDVYVIADNELLQIAADDFAVLSRTPIGEAPYSALVWDGERLFCGGGDPPYDGYLFGIELGDGGRPIHASAVREVIDVAHTDEITVAARILGDVAGLVSVQIDLRCLGGDLGPMTRLMPSLYTVGCKLARGRRFGTYALPLVLAFADGSQVVRTIRVRIEDSKPIPVRFELDMSVPKQVDTNTSGGAVLQSVFAKYGRDTDQREIRRIADQVLASSDDYSPFQLWRLIVRRVAASPASTLEEFQSRGP
jgi:outer membrane protein assembly factor BamB